MKEIWSPIIGYEDDYEVSNIGNVRTTYKMCKYSRGNKYYEKKSRILYKNINKKGYYSVFLYKDGHKKLIPISRLVATAYIDNPENKPQVNHINDIKTDNRAENLNWMTNKENCNWGNHSENIRKKVSKPVTQINMSGEVVKYWESSDIIHKELGYSTGYISDCCHGKHKSAHGFKWEFTYA